MKNNFLLVTSLNEGKFLVLNINKIISIEDSNMGFTIIKDIHNNIYKTFEETKFVLKKIGELNEH